MTLLNPSTRALLIQDIHEYQSFLKKPLEAILMAYMNTGVTEEETLLWIIRETIERGKLLFDPDHRRDHRYLPLIYQELDHRLNGRLEQITHGCIKVPELWGDNNTIRVVMTRFDLLIYYFRPGHQTLV